MIGRRRPARRGLIVGAAALVVVALVAAAAPACRAQNPDHCLHKAADADAWCEENTEGTPHCSACVADNHGCVAEPPSECPADDAASSTGDLGSSSGDGGGSA